MDGAWPAWGKTKPDPAQTLGLEIYLHLNRQGFRLREERLGDWTPGFRRGRATYTCSPVNISLQWPKRPPKAKMLPHQLPRKPPLRRLLQSPPKVRRCPGPPLPALVSGKLLTCRY